METKKASFKMVELVGIVVRDLDRSIEMYKSYGFIGPWREFMAGSDTVKEPKVDGKPVDELKLRFGMCDCGDVTIELIQPLDESTDFGRFLKEHGEGVHHLMLTPNPEFYEVMKEKDIQELVSLTMPQFHAHGRYLSTRADLGMNIYVWDPDPQRDKMKYPQDFVSTGAYKLNV